MAFLNKKTANPDVYSGKPNNKPYTGDLILDLSSTRSTYEEILSDNPKTEKDNILARLMYAGKATRYYSSCSYIYV